MGVDGCVTCCSCQVLVLAVRDVQVCLGVTVFLRQTEINDIDLIATFPDTHQEVIRFDIAVDEGLGMDILDSADQLIGKQEHGLQGELSVTEIEEVLQAGAQEVDDHGVVVTFSAVPADKGNADTTGKRFVDAGFIFKLGMFGLDGLELDGDFLARDDVGAEIDVTEGAGANFASDAVFVADTEVLGGG